jgi:hypothetical protein
MKPTSIKPSLIQHEVLCYNCRGTGHTSPHHTLGKLIAMMDEEDGPNYKINFIKLIRSQWDMGLREAKEVAEAALNFRLAVMDAVKRTPIETDTVKVDVGVGLTNIEAFNAELDNAMYVEEQ